MLCNIFFIRATYTFTTFGLWGHKPIKKCGSQWIKCRSEMLQNIKSTNFATAFMQYWFQTHIPGHGFKAIYTNTNRRETICSWWSILAHTSMAQCKDYGNSMATASESLKSCTKPLICTGSIFKRSNSTSGNISWELEITSMTFSPWQHIFITNILEI